MPRAQNNVDEPTAPVLGRWEYPTTPFHRVHVDHAGPFLGTYWLVWVDAYSKYAGVHRVKRPDAELTVKTLREVFALFGLPNQLVSDNGPAFIAEEFQEFLRSNGVKHVRSAPYHPQTNGEAERFVQTFKHAMKADDNSVSNAELDRSLQQFLLRYRVTPHATTGRTPSELFLGRKLVTVLDRLRPDLRVKVENQMESQQRQRREKGREPDFAVGDRVYARFWYGQRRWRKGCIVAVAGPLSYDVQVAGELHRRHAAQLLHDRVGGDFEEEERVDEPIALPTPAAFPPVATPTVPPVSPPKPVALPARYCRRRSTASGTAESCCAAARYTAAASSGTAASCCSAATSTAGGQDEATAFATSFVDSHASSTRSIRRRVFGPRL